MRYVAFSRYLSQAHPAIFTAVSMLAAFFAYFCMYAFRKPFAAGTYEGLYLWGLNYKILLVLVQVLGYMLSKIIGIKVVSEMVPRYRAVTIVGLVIFAELALLGFGAVPYPYNFIFLFLNGLPLGMVWGMVFGFLEGRRTTEILGAGFSASVILASGVMKSVGRTLIDSGVPEFWMPAVAGLIFLPLLLLSVWVLHHLPPPTATDEAERTKRIPMDARARWRFFRSLAFGLTALILTYALLGAYRDFRDNFGVELWGAVGVTDSSIFARSEALITVLVLTLIGAMFLVRDSQRAFWVNHGLMLLGGLTVLSGVWGFESGRLAGDCFLLLSGLGLFMAYLPFQCITFERLIAVFRMQATVGFLFYLADASGYIGSVAVMLVKNFGQSTTDWLPFYQQFSYLVGAGVVVLSLASLAYFFRKVAWQFPATVVPPVPSPALDIKTNDIKTTHA